MRKLSIIAFLLLFAVVQLQAGGYQVRVQGHKQTGMGLIGTPMVFGVSGIFYNPGTLSFMQDKYSFSAGVGTIFSNAVYQEIGSDYEARTDNPVGTPFYFYGATKINDNLSAGLGIYTPFGSSAVWEPNWLGQNLIREISLQTIFYQPTVAYKFGDEDRSIGIGAGFIFATGSVDLTRAAGAPVNGEVNLNGSTTAMGFNAGIYIQASPKFSIGVDYRSKIDMEVEDGDATFSNIPASLQDNFPAGNKFTATLPLPANLDAGISFKVNEKLTLAAEMNLVFWSVYDSLNIDFEQNTDVLQDSDNPREYENSMILRLGGEYKLSEKLTCRAGVYYDPTPTNEKYFTPETVSLNTFAYTLGISYKPIKGLSIDASYLQLEGLEDERTYQPEEFSGTYKARTMIPGLGVTYSF